MVFLVGDAKNKINFYFGYLRQILSKLHTFLFITLEWYYTHQL